MYVNTMFSANEDNLIAFAEDGILIFDFFDGSRNLGFFFPVDISNVFDIRSLKTSPDGQVLVMRRATYATNIYFYP